ncbi:MAG TPA: carboxymuconolactone decarboxylase family protein [Devosia sp.]|nr:carboxymuconolactone decarboxylase family protein [Devosia sp.]
MDETRFNKGLETRKAVLSPAHVERTFADMDEFSRPLQYLITEFCWGAGWADDALDRASRSILTLGILATLGRFGEFETHVRAGMRNGLTPAQLQALVTHIAIYCGMPVAVECARSIQKILKQTPGQA